MVIERPIEENAAEIDPYSDSYSIIVSEISDSKPSNLSAMITLIGPPENSYSTVPGSYNTHTSEFSANVLFNEYVTVRVPPLTGNSKVTVRIVTSTSLPS